MAQRVQHTFSINNELNNHRPASSMDEIKFCGYLRKKRNKVGGWRKLWFVLRERLLVSYSSKEEYDNKLVSFKDVLNLVPGTQVRPLDGLRFTIETTTLLIYTFHCDDYAAYREWISTLLESLGGRTVAMPNCSHRFRHISMDDIPNTLRIQATATDSSLNSTIDAEHNFTSRVSEVKKIFDRNVNKLNSSLEEARTRSTNKYFANPMISSQALKKQIEQMSISGTRDCRRTTLPDSLEEHERSKVVTSQTTKETITRPRRPHASDENIAKNRSGTEPIYAVVDLKNKYAHRKLRTASMDVRRCSSYESIFQNETEQERSTNNQVEVIYEDGDIYYNRSVGEQKLMCEEKTGFPEVEENIYEPINVGQQTSMFTLRKYIARLKIKPFLRVPKAPSHRYDANITFYPISRFSSFRWKFGQHRRSMQQRMRKLCFEPKPLFRYHGKETNSSAGPPPPLPVPTSRKTVNSKTTNPTESCNCSLETENNPKQHRKLLGKGVLQRFEGFTHLKKSFLSANIENSLHK